MSTSINVHPNNWNDGFTGRLRFTAQLDSWPNTIKVTYTDGGPTIAGNHETGIFIDDFGADALREMATSAEKMSEQLFAHANKKEQGESNG